MREIITSTRNLAKIPRDGIVMQFRRERTTNTLIGQHNSYLHSKSYPSTHW